MNVSLYAGKRKPPNAIIVRRVSNLELLDNDRRQHVRDKINDFVDIALHIHPNKRPSAI